MATASERFAHLQQKSSKHVARAVLNVLAKSGAIHDAQSDAEDVIQDVWIKTWNALESGQEIDAHWVSVVAVNTAKNYRRNVQNRARTVCRSIDEPVAGEDGTEADFMDTYVSPDHRRMTDDRPSRLLEALQDAPDGTVEILAMHFVEGMAMAQIAARLGISLSAAQKRYQRAIAAVKANSSPDNDKLAA